MTPARTATATNAVRIPCPSAMAPTGHGACDGPDTEEERRGAQSGSRPLRKDLIAPNGKQSRHGHERWPIKDRRQSDGDQLTGRDG